MPGQFNEQDISRIKAHGLSQDAVHEQLDRFRTGFPCLPIIRPASVGDGIRVLDPDEMDEYASYYVAASAELDVEKFIPASGAATRMFRELFEYRDTGVATVGLRKLVGNADKLAFFDMLGIDEDTQPQDVAGKILEYGGQLPKALIYFHAYPDGSRTAMEEHLVEAAMYAAESGRARLHFTVSPEHEEGFRRRLKEVKESYEKRFGVKYDISFSRQDPSTDTIAATPDKEPFRDGGGDLVFRPAGHGALLLNLNDRDADVIFIKNIDNVTTDRLKQDTVLNKKALAGLLLLLRGEICGYLDAFDKGSDARLVENASVFVEKELSCSLPEGFVALTLEEKTEVLRKLLDRPLRVCAMVRNEGEPGGGPFWVSNPDGTRSLQIAEPSQIAPEQRYMLKEGTHFNPVDIVCSTKDCKGRKYDLSRFSDPETGIISEKSLDGRPLLALELPGLWNGSMARWNTVFVEVPVSTFTPVKEVLDLLRPEHM